MTPAQEALQKKLGKDVVINSTKVIATNGGYVAVMSINGKSGWIEIPDTFHESKEMTEQMQSNAMHDTEIIQPEEVADLEPVPPVLNPDGSHNAEMSYYAKQTAQNIQAPADESTELAD